MDISERPKKQILVADDSEDMRFLLGQILEDEDYDVIFAHDGQEALMQAKEHHPDLILMDMSMPGINGWEAVMQLRKKEKFRQTPIIAVTAHTSKQDEERAYAIGCNVHVSKPFDVEALLDVIARFLA